MYIELSYEQIDDLFVQELKEKHENTLNILSNTLNDIEFSAVHTFDFDEEVFELIDDLLSYERVMSEYGGQPNKSVMKFLEETNNLIYTTQKTMNDLINENRSLIQSNNILKEELTELKDKIKKLINI